MKARDAPRFVAALTRELVEAAKEPFGRAHARELRKVEPGELRRGKNARKWPIRSARETARGHRHGLFRQKLLGQERRAPIDAREIFPLGEPREKTPLERRVARKARKIRRVFERLGDVRFAAGA